MNRLSGAIIDCGTILALLLVMGFVANLPAYGQDSGAGSNSGAPVFDQFHAPPLLPSRAVPELNFKVVNFAVDQLGKVVGDGECWTLAKEALLAAGAQTPKDYVFGRELEPNDKLLPGDIVQFTKCKFVEIQGTRKTTRSLGSPNHTAIIYGVVNPRVVLLQQNISGDKRVQTTVLNFSQKVSGILKIYRPVPANTALSDGGSAAQQGYSEAGQSPQGPSGVGFQQGATGAAGIPYAQQPTGPGYSGSVPYQQGWSAPANGGEGQYLQRPSGSGYGLPYLQGAGAPGYSGQVAYPQAPTGPGYSGQAAYPQAPTAPGYSGQAAYPQAPTGYSGQAPYPQAPTGYSGQAYPQAPTGPGYSGQAAYPQQAPTAPGYSGQTTYPQAPTAPGYGGQTAYPQAPSGPGYSGQAYPQQTNGSTFGKAGSYPQAPGSNNPQAHPQ